MLKKTYIATNVVVKIKLHCALTFRNEGLGISESTLTKNLGNVTEDTIFSFEYTIKKISQLLELEDLKLEPNTKFSVLSSNLFYCT